MDIVRRLHRKLVLLEENGYVLINDSSCILGLQSMAAPDLAALKEDRCKQAVANDSWLQGAPKLVIEVSSPGNRSFRRNLQDGAEQVWILYRKTQTVVVVTQEDASEARSGESVEFGGVRIDVEVIFKAQ